jgi:hypothetical protein
MKEATAVVVLGCILTWPCGPDRVRDPVPRIHTYSSFLVSNSFTNCGFAWPLEAFIT